MIPTELDDALGAMQLAPAGNPDLMPGLITVESNHWVQVHVGSTQATKVLMRGEASDRGAPYRDLMPRV